MSHDCKVHRIPATMANQIPCALWVRSPWKTPTTPIRIGGKDDFPSDFQCLSPSYRSSSQSQDDIGLSGTPDSCICTMRRESLKENESRFTTYAENHQSPLGIAWGFWCNVHWISPAKLLATRSKPRDYFILIYLTIRIFTNGATEVFQWYFR